MKEALHKKDVVKVIKSLVISTDGISLGAALEGIVWWIAQYPKKDIPGILRLINAFPYDEYKDECEKRGIAPKVSLIDMGEP